MKEIEPRETPSRAKSSVNDPSGRPRNVKEPSVATVVEIAGLPATETVTVPTIEETPDANLVVLGDLNDTYNTKAIKEVVGVGKNKLVDTRPAEKNGDNLPNPANPRYSPRNEAWTHYYGVEDSYSRIDYILLSPGMAKEWMKDQTYIPVIANWGQASDHRPVLATFEAADK